MALDVTDVQGTKAYLAATTVATSNIAEIQAAIAGGVQIGCIQAIGTISATKTVTEYTCISSDESSKSIGSKSLGNFPLSTLFNALDTVGQADLRDMWDNNTRRKIIFELSDNAGTSPTYYVFETFPSTQDVGLEKDNAVMYDMTMEISSTPIFTLATA